MNIAIEELQRRIDLYERQAKDADEEAECMDRRAQGKRESAASNREVCAALATAIEALKAVRDGMT